MLAERPCRAVAAGSWFDAETSLPFAAGMVGRGMGPVLRSSWADKMKTQTIGAALRLSRGWRRGRGRWPIRAAFLFQAIGLKYDLRLTSRPRVA